MGFCCYCLSVLLLLSSTQVRYSVEGRSVSMPPEAAKDGRGEEEGMVLVSSKIGSRPPRCERRCISCGHCEAVQVPVAPQERSGAIRHFFNTITSRSDDTSNYKPMSWKCKCGNTILNP